MISGDFEYGLEGIRENKRLQSKEKRYINTIGQYYNIKLLY